MKSKNTLVVLILMAGILTFSCSSTGYNTQKGAAIGAGLGAIAGQIIGNNTSGTLIGAAAGALGGTIAGNAVDQNETNQKMATAQSQSTVYASPSGNENPPGQWVEVPGQWVGGKWIPTHKAWVPVNP